MKVLIVAATSMEVKLLVDELEKVDEMTHFLKTYKLCETEVDILITGIGTTFTAFHLTNALREKKYDRIVNMGIAGSLTYDLKIGEVVNVISEEFADLGIEKNNEFLTLFEAGFIDVNDFPFDHGVIKASDAFDWIALRNVRGITSNRSYGRKNSIAELKQKFNAHVESMEGAAVLYVCNWFGVDCYQVRAISNYVEPRDSAKWNIPLALDKLKETMMDILKKLSVPVN